MKWYHPIPCDNTVNNPYVAGEADLKGYSEWDFSKGRKIDNWNENVNFKADKIEDDGDPDDVLQHLFITLIPIYSRPLQEALFKGGIQGIQYLPIKVYRPNNGLIEGFSIANILFSIEALDLNRSKYNRFSDDFPNVKKRGMIDGIIKSVLIKEKLKDMNIIRLKEYKQHIFISDKFREIFEKNKFTGYSFDEVELS